MQNTRNFFQYVINHLRSEVKYPEKFRRPQLQLAARGRNYYSGLKRAFARINLRRESGCGRTKWKRGKPNRELCGKDRKQFH